MISGAPRFLCSLCPLDSSVNFECKARWRSTCDRETDEVPGFIFWGLGRCSVTLNLFLSLLNPIFLVLYSHLMLVLRSLGDQSGCFLAHSCCLGLLRSRAPRESSRYRLHPGVYIFSREYKKLFTAMPPGSLNHTLRPNPKTNPDVLEALVMGATACSSPQEIFL